MSTHDTPPTPSREDLLRFAQWLDAWGLFDKGVSTPEMLVETYFEERN